LQHNEKEQKEGGQGK